MQSKHHPAIQTHHISSEAAMQIQQQTELGQQQQQQQRTTVTVLESLEPVQAQPVLSILDPASHQEQPQLHQLQAPAKSHHNQQQHHLEQQQQQQQQQQIPNQHHAQQLDDNQMNISRGQQQRPHIEGIVADGGGPIVQWLLDNYEIADGESLPRSTVYNHYLAHCRQLQMSSVNAASFGKLIRSVFIGLKTRRLGTRGHSKYHYFGVRAKQHVCLDWVHDEQQLLGGCSSSSLNNNENSNHNNTDNTDSADDCLSSSSGNTKRLRKSAQQHHHHSKHYNLIEAQPDDERHHQQQHHHHHQHHHHLHGQQAAEQGSNDFYHADVPTIQANLDQQHHQHEQQQQQQQQQQYQGAKLNGFAANGGGGAVGEQTATNTNSGANYVWPTANYCNATDYRNSLGANGPTLIDDHWPAREDSLLLFSRQQVGDRPASAVGGGAAAAAVEASAIDNHHHTINLLNAFEINYKSYYKRMIELLGELKFAEVEQLWFDFWHPAPAGTNSSGVASASAFRGAATVHWTTGDENELALMSAPMVEQALNSNGTDPSGDHHRVQQQQQQQQQQQPEGHYQQQQHPRAPLMGTVAHLSNNLTFNHLYQLTSQSRVIERINQIDYSLFQAIEKFLVPELLAPIPRPLVQQLRMFAKNFSTWIELAIKDLPHQFVSEKSRSAQAFGHALLRYTSINHLAVASRAIWDKRSILAQMSADLSRIDLRDIEHQVSLMSQDKEDEKEPPPPAAATAAHCNGDGVKRENGACESAAAAAAGAQFSPPEASVQQQQHKLDSDEQVLSANQAVGDRSFAAMQPAQLIQDFLNLLEDPYVGNYWSDWCRNLVEFCGHSFGDAKNFILKWNFYISLILKELTLKSAPSLGPFQLIKLLFDEYIYYLVVAKLARAQNKTFAQLLKPSTTPIAAGPTSTTTAANAATNAATTAATTNTTTSMSRQQIHEDETV